MKIFDQVFWFRRGGENLLLRPTMRLYGPKGCGGTVSGLRPRWIVNDGGT
jgi:hypothetical protein